MWMVTAMSAGLAASAVLITSTLIKCWRSGSSPLADAFARQAGSFRNAKIVSSNCRYRQPSAYSPATSAA